MIRTLALPAILGMAGAAPALAQQHSTWSLISDNPSLAVAGHRMAFDSLRARTILFGGLTSNGETWAWDMSLQSWSLANTTGPSRRASHAMVYEVHRGRVLLFGGQDATNRFGDTWEWDGTSWTQLTAAGPSPRWGHTMSYDTVRQRTVLFGGFTTAYSGETWEWMGSAWQPLPFAVGPSPRHGHAMCYDSVRGSTLLHGGFNGLSLADTWSWNGMAWSLVANSGPSARSNHAMVFQTHNGRALLFGGSSGGDETWEWDGQQWQARTGSPRPPTRFNHAMAYDDQHGVALLHGGGGFSATLRDTWLSRIIGLAKAYGTGCGTPPLVFVPVPGSRPRLGTTAQALVTNVPNGVAHVALGLSRTQAGFFSLPLSLAGYGMPGCDLLQSFESTSEPTVPAGAGSAVYSLAIPNAPALIGLRVYLQAWGLAIGQNAGNAMVSNGIEWRIGEA